LAVFKDTVEGRIELGSRLEKLTNSKPPQEVGFCS
jgi:hypothetical protein